MICQNLHIFTKRLRLASEHANSFENFVSWFKAFIRCKMLIIQKRDILIPSKGSQEQAKKQILQNCIPRWLV